MPLDTLDGISSAMTNKPFSLVKKHTGSKTFYVNEVINSVVSPYDLTLKTLALRVVDRAVIPNLILNIAPITQGLGFCTFDFDKNQTDRIGSFDYILVEDFVGTNKLLSYGVLTIHDVDTYIPLKDIIETETPAGVVIPESFMNTKIYEWKLFMQKAFDPNIADVDFNNELAWPILVRFLIAKLVVHDYLIKSLKSFIVQNDSTSEINSANVKRIETGPSNVEYFDSIKSVGDLLKKNPNGASALDSLVYSICTLASKLHIYIPAICGVKVEDAIIPIKTYLPDPIDPIQILNDNYSE